MGGIREFNCACLIVSLLLALLLNTSRSFTLLRINCLVSTVVTPLVSFDTQPIKKPEEEEHETPRYHGV
jgi:hypothetical protein